MNHFIFFQVTVSYQSGYDESIANTQLFSHFEFNKSQWLYSVDLNLVLVCVMNVVKGTNSYVWTMPGITPESSESFWRICLHPIHSVLSLFLM